MVEEKKKTAQQPLTEEKPEEKVWEKHGMTKEQYEKLQGIEPEDKENMEQIMKEAHEEPPYPSAEKGELLPAKKEDVAFRVSEIYGVPKYFVLMMGAPGNEHPFVTTEGLALKTEKKRPRAIQTDEVKEIKDGTGKAAGWQCVSRIFPRITKEEIEMVKAAQSLAPDVQKELLKSLLQPYTAIGTATKENTKNPKMLPYLLELAQTRAKNRAMRSFTACGLTSVEEMPDYQGEEAGDK